MTQLTLDISPLHGWLVEICLVRILEKGSLSWLSI